MRPPGFLSIALRRGSNASQSSVEDESVPTTPGPAPRHPGTDGQGEAGTVQQDPNTNNTTTATTLSPTDTANRPVPQNQIDSKLRPRPNLDPDSDLESKLEATDRKTKESVKVHYFPKDKPVYSCRKCLVPIVRPHLYLHLHRHDPCTNLWE
jgi:hypothetical protein